MSSLILAAFIWKPRRLELKAWSMMGLNFETHDLMTWIYIYELFNNVYEVYSQDDL